MSALGRLCCKSPGMPGSVAAARRQGAASVNERVVIDGNWVGLLFSVTVKTADVGGSSRSLATNFAIFYANLRFSAILCARRSGLTSPSTRPNGPTTRGLAGVLSPTRCRRWPPPPRGRFASIQYLLFHAATERALTLGILWRTYAAENYQYTPIGSRASRWKLISPDRRLLRLPFAAKLSRCNSGKSPERASEMRRVGVA
ncbi:hypothetical protein ACVWYH_005784 [Bradyrhizobium sp. GM24.11]